MGERNIKTLAWRAGVLFIAFVACFILFRHPIARLNAKLLVATGDLPPSALKKKIDKIPDKTTTIIKPNNKKSVKKAENRIRSNKDRQRYLDGNPVTSKLPETPTPSIPFSKDLSTDASPAFPDMRGFDGTVIPHPTIRVKAATNGKAIRFDCMLTGKKTLKTCQVEILAMADRNSKRFISYATDLKGNFEVAMFKTLKSPRTRRPAEDPHSKAESSLVETSEGTILRFDIPVADLDLPRLKPGDRILLQIILRNGNANRASSSAMHLFPTHIYADNRFGPDNNDTRALRPVKITNGAEK